MIINSMKAAKDFAAALVDGQEVGLFTDYPILVPYHARLFLKTKGLQVWLLQKIENVKSFCI